MHDASYWIRVIESLADPGTGIEVEGAAALFTRRGEEQIISVVDVPGSGLCVNHDDNLIPFDSYVQRHILGLDGLARQISSTLEARGSERPVGFIEGPAHVQDDTAEQIPECTSYVRAYISESLPGSTKILQLMADAGQGKTMLLEEVALQQARSYEPDPHPNPLLLPVDLLGRYVGNIEDAIAGTLNNTFVFPNLTQADVILAARQKWLSLALDGFDELVSRIGTRDAFNRINDLLDQLEGRGAVILSARKNFFELYQISVSMRTYLQPRRGAYRIATIDLQPWSHIQGERVFESLGKPASDFYKVKDLFRNDDTIITQPFMLTRVAQLWANHDERFRGTDELAGSLSSYARMDLVLRYFLDREASEKWIDADSQPILSTEQHYRMLGGVAEEMWRSQAFQLDREELGLSAKMALDGLVPPDALELIEERVPTHAALTHRSRRYQFLNDQFFYLFLGRHLGEALLEDNSETLTEVLSAADMNPTMLEWFMVVLANSEHGFRNGMETIDRLSDQVGGQQVRVNLGSLAARILRSADESGTDELAGVHLRNLTFLGDALKGVTLTATVFEECSFWNCDLRDAQFVECEFRSCDVGQMSTSKMTSFADSTFVDTEIAGVEEEEGSAHFAPVQVKAYLRRKGADVGVSEGGGEDPEGEIAPSVDQEVMKALRKMVHLSMRAWEFTFEDYRGASHANEETIEYLMDCAVREGVLETKEEYLGTTTNLLQVCC